jgi:hypothetical protein
MVSHDLHLVMAATDKVICLNGHICCHGHPEAVSNHPEYLRLFGLQGSQGLAVYSHHHDHQHDANGCIHSVPQTYLLFRSRLNNMWELLWPAWLAGCLIALSGCSVRQFIGVAQISLFW